MHGHKGPVSALSLQHDEKGFFSAGWDGEAIVSSSAHTYSQGLLNPSKQWDLNNGQIVRKFSAHGAQLAAVAVRPLSTNFIHNPWSTITAGSEFTVSMRGSRDDQTNAPSSYEASMPPPPPPSNTATFEGRSLYTMKQEDDAKSNDSFESLFDGEPDGNAPAPSSNPFPTAGQPSAQPSAQHMGRGAIAPKGAPPVLDPATYATFSPDMLMTAHVDGQVILWDRRVSAVGKGVGRMWMSEKTPPWCMSVRVSPSMGNTMN